MTTGTWGTFGNSRLIELISSCRNGKKKILTQRGNLYGITLVAILWPIRLERKRRVFTKQVKLPNVTAKVQSHIIS